MLQHGATPVTNPSHATFTTEPVRIIVLFGEGVDPRFRSRMQSTDTVSRSRGAKAPIQPPLTAGASAARWLGCTLGAVGLALLLKSLPTTDPLLLRALHSIGLGATIGSGERVLATAIDFGVLALIVGLTLALLVPRTTGAAGILSQLDVARFAADVRLPDPVRFMLGALASGVAITVLFVLRWRFGIGPRSLIAKEGSLEALTFIMFIVAAVLCGRAAWYQWRERDSLGPVFLAATVLSFVLWLIAMEEIAWGQTYLGFGTPERLLAINYQGETTLHNLLDRTQLDAVTRWAAAVFAIGVLASQWWPRRGIVSRMRWLVPPVSLIPLALVCAYTGVFIHAEPFEAQLSLFFACYGYRLLRVAQAGV